MPKHAAALAGLTELESNTNNKKPALKAGFLLPKI
jgi:hypothetical protein